MELPNIYKGNYKMLIIYPLILILLSLYFIPKIEMGVDFKGGTLITLTLNENADAKVLQSQLAAEGLNAEVKVFDTALGYKAEIEVPQDDKLVRADQLKTQFIDKIPKFALLEANEEKNSTDVEEYNSLKSDVRMLVTNMSGINGNTVDISDVTNPNDLERKFYEQYNLAYQNYRNSISKPIEKHVSYSSISVQTVSPLLSLRFIDKAVGVVVASAILSTIFVFIFFRKPAPSLAVITGAASDVIIALGAMGLFGIPLTLPSFAALLMLIGFSLDTDILLTMRILKQEGDHRENAHSAMKTGVTMSIAAIVAFSVLFILATATHIPTYFEISAVALAGLVGDLFATWGINAVMLLWYVERSERKP